MSDRFNRDRFRDYQQCRRRFHHDRRRDKNIFGAAIIIIGVLLLLRTLNVFYVSYLFTWQMILIAAGLFVGLKSRFHNPAWWILILIGIINLTPSFRLFGQPSTNFIWPATLIVAGAAIILRPRRYPHFKDNMSTMTTSENTLNIDVTFGGRKEIVTSKDFRGGQISATFGGAEINLMQADTTQQFITLEFKVSFGGVELIVPSHWEVQNEVSASFGSVEDERTIRTPAAGEEKKILLLKGTCSFGSIEIKSY